MPAVYDQYAEIYDQAFTRPIDLVENKVVFDIIANLPGYGEGVNLLDLGCGTGLTLDYLDPDRYVGVDISEEMLRVARRKHPDHLFLNCDMTNLQDFGPDTFTHAISTFGSASYTPDLAGVAWETHRVLIPGGAFCHVIFSHRYHWRKSHMARETGLIYTWDKKDVYSAFRGFRDVGVQGLTMLEYAPLAHLASFTLGKLIPELFYLWIVTGVK